MSGHDFDEQRLAFGAVAELYDRARPSYPSAAVDGLIEYAGLDAGDNPAMAAQPDIPAVTVYSRPGCHLCVDAMAVLEGLRESSASSCRRST